MNTAATQQHFTAAQIARALGNKRQALARVLADTRADGCSVVRGQTAAAWSFASLPAPMQKELEHSAQRRGFRNVESLLAEPPQLWQPPVPLAEIAQHSLDNAAKMQRALSRALAVHNDPSIKSAELEQIAIQDYRREFGHAITDRAVRTLLKRTLDRDAGALNFSRLELYLPERPALKTADKPSVALETQSQFRPLLDAIAAFKYPSNPSPKEKNYLWLLAFETYEEKLADGKAPKKLKRALLDFLTRNAPFLARAESNIANAIRANFDLKYKKWTGANRDAAALADARAENSGNFRKPELTTADRDKLIAHATMNCGGRVAQAWRELNERRELSEDLLGYYLSNPASKSYVPRRIMDAVKHEVEMLEDLHHGPRQAKLNGAHIIRDWTSVAAGDWFQADDGTMPVYYTVPDGNGWFEILRGQVLLMIDLRTTRILGFVLISERNYSANAIRTLISKVCDQYGLPRKGFYFENGSWKARIIKGVATDEAMSWGESELGLREFGLRFVHARLPRAKPVEGIMNATQNLMEGLPGYVGRNEQTEKFERVQKQMLQIKARKLDPAGILMTEEQWIQQLENLCERYNAARNDGKMTCGLSPNEAFEKFSNPADPPVKFSPACRYLLAHHRRPVNVTANGITLRFGKNAFNYRSAETGKLIGQRVFAWFNPETPEMLTVTDTRRENPFTVARTQEVPAMDAPAEIMAQEMERINAHQSYARSRYRVLKATYAQPFRPMIADRATVELGAEIITQRETLETAQRETARLETKGRNAARKLQLAIPADKLRRPETAPALERLNELLADDDSTKETQP